MWTKRNDDFGPQGSEETLTSYEEAAKEFAGSAAEFLQHIALLTKARDAYQRAMTISARLRETLDSGDEHLRNLMGQLERAIQVQLSNDTSDKKPEPANVETIKASGEKVDAARA
jgi:exonuclease VII small subunit